ncbi:two-component sensor histidine kinase [Amycolatopsis sp. WAC 01375]|uniref:sensor histidine kinase n=1 Tax=unclassified Amycolatopsis TaxID=2618356 RepID=UPI000F78DF84|nr:MULTISPECIES: histidine kinase [unclassified Amycolatopsis]RSM83723.1 two-component sensor histidine kinase [Amycolatopsis sp. WAC 01375]RSN34095.1 two-component sensor histidine kinase [Amycolatopsis sp. WAC 01416]
MPTLVPRLNHLPLWKQDLVIALGTWLIGVLVYLSGTQVLLNGPDSTPLWIRLTELTALCALEMLRRKVPWALLGALVVVAVDVAISPSLPILVVFTDFLYATTLYGSRRMSRVMIGIAAIGTLAVICLALVLSSQWRTAILVAFAFLPFLVTPVWWAANVRQQRDIAENERANAVQLATIGELDRRAAVAGERSKMARDLHDVIAGHLSAIAIQSEAALSMATADPKLSRKVLESVRENSVSALDEMRAMIGLLRADTEIEPTAPARLAELSKLVESARASGLEVELGSVPDPSSPLPAAVDLTAYRIAQEALTNAVKHAPGGRAVLDIRSRGGILTVEVRNDLQPGRLDDGGTGLGLLNMRERAAAVGGTLAAGPSGGGWLVRAELPLEGS